MAQRRRQTVKESQVTGTTSLRKLPPPVERLPDEVCGRDKAGNRPSHPIRVVEVQRKTIESVVRFGKYVPGWRAERSCGFRLRNDRSSR